MGRRRVLSATDAEGDESEITLSDAEGVTDNRPGPPVPPRLKRGRNQIQQKQGERNFNRRTASFDDEATSDEEGNGETHGEESDAETEAESELDVDHRPHDGLEPAVSGKQMRSSAFLVLGGLAVLLIAMNVAFGSQNRQLAQVQLGVDNDLLICDTVPKDPDHMLVHCTPRPGYAIRVIESRSSGILLEVRGEPESKPVPVVGAGVNTLADEYSEVGAAVGTYLKYLMYFFILGALTAFYGTEQGKRSAKILQRKYGELSTQLRGKIEEGFATYREHQQTAPSGRGSKGRLPKSAPTDSDYGSDEE